MFCAKSLHGLRLIRDWSLDGHIHGDRILRIEQSADNAKVPAAMRRAWKRCRGTVFGSSWSACRAREVILRSYSRQIHHGFRAPRPTGKKYLSVRGVGPKAAYEG